MLNWGIVEVPFKKSPCNANSTRTTNVVRNAGCARPRYTQKFFLKSIDESMNQLTEYI